MYKRVGLTTEGRITEIVIKNERLPRKYAKNVEYFGGNVRYLVPHSAVTPLGLITNVF